jgi:2-polyprenyl-3-methyl-5-hydroxy-6-metoxy-1,4-benzoquinol methylase
VKTTLVDHWDRIYSERPSTTLSWYERDPCTSLGLIEQTASDRSAAVIDIGAGTSFLVDRLLADGFSDITVLDLSRHALLEVEQRLGNRAMSVTLVQHDVLTWTPERKYDIWHDRAVYHFLTLTTARDTYIEIASDTIRKGGSLVLATFAADGPAQCSGLPVVRYSANDLAQVFSASFSLVAQEREEHATPSGVIQPFTWVVLRRT